MNKKDDKKEDKKNVKDAINLIDNARIAHKEKKIAAEHAALEILQGEKVNFELVSNDSDDLYDSNQNQTNSNEHEYRQNMNHQNYDQPFYQFVSCKKLSGQHLQTN